MSNTEITDMLKNFSRRLELLSEMDLELRSAMLTHMIQELEMLKEENDKLIN